MQKIHWLFSIKISYKIHYELCYNFVVWRMHMNQEKIGKYIRKIRKDNNLSQEKFAEKLGVTFQAVSKWGRCRSTL